MIAKAGFGATQGNVDSVLIHRDDWRQIELSRLAIDYRKVSDAMHEQLRQDAIAAGLDPLAVEGVARYLNATERDRTAARSGYRIPKPSGTKERRKAERQNRKHGRNINRRR